MEKIDEQLNRLSMTEIPASLHNGVMQVINYKRLKPILFVSISLLFINASALVWHINGRLIDAEFADMTADFFEVFHFSFSFFITTFNNFLEIIPVELVLSFIFSLFGIIYLGNKITIYNKTKYSF